MRVKAGRWVRKERSFTPPTAASIGPAKEATRSIRWNECSSPAKTAVGPSASAAPSSLTCGTKFLRLTNRSRAMKIIFILLIVVSTAGFNALAQDKDNTPDPVKSLRDQIEVAASPSDRNRLQLKLADLLVS